MDQADCQPILFHTIDKIMPDISISLYALPDELISFAAAAIDDFNLCAVAMRYPPFEIVEIRGDDLKDLFANPIPFREVAFMLVPPALTAKGRMEFIDKNRDQLSIQIGRQTANGLEESILSCRTDNDDTLAIWRTITNRLKQQTQAGVTAINRQSGISAYYRSTRYTQGAKALEISGVAMVPFQGSNGPRILLGARQ